jgi:hypothetical protein
MQRSIGLLLLFTTAPLGAANLSPARVAMLVEDAAPDGAVLAEALKDPSSVTRATAARVITVRNLVSQLPAVQDALAHEKDSDAAREQIRALVIVGGEEAVDVAVAASARWPPSMDAELALAVARRSGVGAVDLYLRKLRGLRLFPAHEFFRLALWGHGELAAVNGARLLGSNDAKGWSALLDAMREAAIVVPSGVLYASLDASSEEIRNATVWFLARSYAPEPSAIHELLKDALTAPREVASNREGFGRELLRRMLGADKADQQKWIDWLGSDEADREVPDDPELLSYMTDREYAAHRNRCGMKPNECAIPLQRVSASVIKSQGVAPPVFTLPDSLPRGLANEILAVTHCRDRWLGLAGANVDRAGRVQTLDLSHVPTSSECTRALSAILKLSLARDTDIRSGFSAKDVLLIHEAGDSLCLDEEPVSSVDVTGLHRTGGNVTAPKVLKRTEPEFPASAREKMHWSKGVIVIMEMIITKDGCPRQIRPILQSPVPELNGAALLAVSRWKFSPGLLDGHPVDVIFNLTIHFKVN